MNLNFILKFWIKIFKTKNKTASFQALCEVVDEFAKSENSVNFENKPNDNDDENSRSRSKNLFLFNNKFIVQNDFKGNLKKLIEDVLKNDVLKESTETDVRISLFLKKDGFLFPILLRLVFIKETIRIIIKLIKK